MSNTNGTTSGPSNTPPATTVVAQAPVRAATQAPVEAGNATAPVLSNSLRVWTEVHAQPAVAGKTMRQHLEGDAASIPIEARIRLIEIIIRNETANTTPDFQSKITQLKSYYDRQLLMSVEERVNQANQGQEVFFERLVNELKNVNQIMPTNEPGAVERMSDGFGNTVLSGARGAANFVDRLPPALQGAGFIIGALALYKVAQNFIAGGKFTRAMVYTLGGLGLAYVSAGPISRAINGRTLSQNIDDLFAGGERSEAAARYATYFNVNLSNSRQSVELNLLMEAFYESSIFSVRPFSDIYNLYSESKRDASLPPGTLAGSSFDSVPEGGNKESLMFGSLNLFFTKFGPGSALYTSNPAIRARFDNLLTGRVSFRQGASDLLALDPSAPRPSAEQPSAISGAVNGSISFVRENFEAALTALGTGYVTVKNLVMEKYTEIVAALGPAGINRWLNKSINNKSEFGQFEDQVGLFVNQALNSTAGIYRDSTGITYGAYEISMTQEQFTSSSHRISVIAQQTKVFKDKIKELYPNVEGKVEVLYGAQMSQASGGKYYLSFAFIPDSIPMVSSRLIPSESFDLQRSFNDYRDFRLNSHEVEVLMTYYQVTSLSALTTILNRIRTSHIAAGKTPLEMASSGGLMNDTLRSTLVPTIDQVKAAYFAEMLRLNATIAGNDNLKRNSLDATVAIMARNPAYATLRGITAAYGTPEFVVEYTEEALSLFN